MAVKFIVHKNLTDDDLNEVINIKSVAWPYAPDKQVEWIEQNLQDSDIHTFLLDEEERVLAYLNLINIVLEINGEEYAGLGVGNVCALKRGSGDGGRLMNEVNSYIITRDLIGLLFCKDGLLRFYEHAGWMLLPAQTLSIKQIDSRSVHTMILNFNKEINNLTYSGRLF